MALVKYLVYRWHQHTSRNVLHYVHPTAYNRLLQKSIVWWQRRHPHLRYGVMMGIFLASEWMVHMQKCHMCAHKLYKYHRTPD